MNLKRHVPIALLALAAAFAPAFAQARSSQIQQLAEVSGLSYRQTHMLFAPARSSFAEYRYAFHRAEKKFVAAVGRERYQQLLAGQPVRFDQQIEGRRVAVVVQIEPAT